jgi:hypothetical protein
LRVGWSRLPGFGVGWPKSNSGKSWMAKNGLYPKKELTERSIFILENHNNFQIRKPHA